MTKPTDEQLAFCAHHKISRSDMLDGHGLSHKECRSRMKDAGALVAFGRTPCAVGHTLRLRSGHCAQCNVAAIAFARRPRLPGYIYVAWSRGAALTKVGFAMDLDRRMRHLTSVGFEGIFDWSLHFALWHTTAGRVELSVHKSLAESGIDRPRPSREIFRCPPQLATAVLQECAATICLN